MADVNSVQSEAKKTSDYIHSVIENPEDADRERSAYTKLMEEIDKESKKPRSEEERKAWAAELMDDLKDILPELSASFARENLNSLGVKNTNKKSDSIYADDLENQTRVLQQEMRGNIDTKRSLTDQLELSFLRNLRENMDTLSDKYDDDGSDADRITVKDIDVFLKENFDRRSADIERKNKEAEVRAEAIKLCGEDGSFFRYLDDKDGDSENGVTRDGLKKYVEDRARYLQGTRGKEPADGPYSATNAQMAQYLLDNWDSDLVKRMRGSHTKTNYLEHGQKQQLTEPNDAITLAVLAKQSGLDNGDSLLKAANPAPAPEAKKQDPPPATETKDPPPPTTEKKDPPPAAAHSDDKPVAHTIAKGEWIWQIIRRDYSNEKGYDPDTRRKIYNWIINNNGPSIKARPELIYESKTLFLPPAKMFEARTT